VRTSPLAIASLIVGLLACTASIMPFLGVVIAVGALITGVVAIIQRRSLPLAIAGTAFSVIACAISVLATVTIFQLAF